MRSIYSYIEALWFELVDVDSVYVATVSKTQRLVLSNIILTSLDSIIARPL